MTVTYKRGLYALVALFTALMGLALAAPRAHAAYNSPPPSSTVAATQVLGEQNVRFCVNNFKPNSPVSIAGQSSTTDANGGACTNVFATTGCHTFTATGTDASGNPATSSQQICVLAVNNSRSLPFTGSDIIKPGIGVAALLIVVGGVTLFAVRRRRSNASS